MKNYRILWVVIFLLGVCFLFTCVSNKTKKDDSLPYERKDFPDFGAMVPVDTFLKNYPGHKIFKLSQDYPREAPTELPDFFKLPFDDKSKWMDWLLAARDYCFKGMVDADFVAQDNKDRNWYHMPWLNY